MELNNAHGFIVYGTLYYFDSYEAALDALTDPGRWFSSTDGLDSDIIPVSQAMVDEQTARFERDAFNQRAQSWAM